MNQYTMMIVQWGSCNVDADLSTSTKEEVIEDNVVRMCKEFGNLMKIQYISNKKQLFFSRLPSFFLHFCNQRLLAKIVLRFSLFLSPLALKKGV